jgi:hypothetical protein
MGTPPVTRRVSELERPQCNCPALGPFLLAEPPSPEVVTAFGKVSSLRVR